jgi:hypothetical protein
MKPLAKSLHTVTVLVRVAKLHLLTSSVSGDRHLSHAMAVDRAIETLGLADMPDVYGLALQAIKQLNKYS